MEYHIYTTPAFVLHNRLKGEANAELTLLIRDVGTVRATAQRARHTASKLRFALQPYSLSQVSLVYGKGGWRLTNAVPLVVYWSRLRQSPLRARLVAARITLLLRQLVSGEETDPQLFFVFYEAMNMLACRHTTTDTHLKAVEHITASRVLARLGYLNTSGRIYSLASTVGFSRDLCKQATSIEPHLIKTINRSLEATQLV